MIITKINRMMNTIILTMTMTIITIVEIMMMMMIQKMMAMNYIMTMFTMVVDYKDDC